MCSNGCRSTSPVDGTSMRGSFSKKMWMAMLCFVGLSRRRCFWWASLRVVLGRERVSPQYYLTLISFVHLPVQDHMKVSFGVLMRMQRELRELQSAAGGVDTVSGDRGGAGKGASTGGNMSLATGPGVTWGPGPGGGVGAGAGAESEYSPFNRGRDEIAGAVYSAVHDICFEACRRLEGESRRGGGLKRAVGVALFRSLLPRGIVVQQEQAVKTSLIQDRRGIRAAVFVELTFVLRAGFLVLYRDGADVHAGHLALSQSLDLGAPAGGAGDTVPEAFPGGGPGVDRHRAKVSECILGWGHHNHRPGDSSVHLQDTLAVADGARHFLAGARNSFAAVLEWEPQGRRERIAAAFEECAEGIQGWAFISVSGADVLRRLEKPGKRGSSPVVLAAVRSYFRDMGLVGDVGDGSFGLRPLAGAGEEDGSRCPEAGGACSGGRRGGGRGQAEDDRQETARGEGAGGARGHVGPNNIKGDVSQLIKVEEYDGSYECLVCSTSVRRAEKAFRCAQCSCNPWHEACAPAGGYAACPQCAQPAIVTFTSLPSCMRQPAAVIDLSGPEGAQDELAEVRRGLAGLPDNLLTLIFGQLDWICDLWLLSDNDSILLLRAACRRFKKVLQPRFLPVIAPPDYVAGKWGEGPLCMETHGKMLIQLFHDYCSWLKKYNEYNGKESKEELASSLKVGDAVHAWYKDEGWFRAMIAKRNADGTFLINWQDKDPADRVKGIQDLERIGQKLKMSALDGFFSLAPWSRSPGEQAQVPFQALQWLHDAVYTDPYGLDPSKTPADTSRFFHRRTRDPEAFRPRTTTPAALFSRFSRTCNHTSNLCQLETCSYQAC